MSILTALVAGLAARNTCSYTKAQSGDGCWALAQRCGITQQQLTTYNPAPFSCNSITVGEYVCCSSGSPPNFAPQQQSNGDCAPYTVQAGDTCSSIANAHQMTQWETIDQVNNQTWGWAGCNLIQAGQNICLSTGTPPFPAPVANTVCGPQVPNTTQPTNMSPNQWGEINPCPLNACCDIWGQCGISRDFCTMDPADTGAPGTAKPGSNGCISNCGTSIINNAVPPSAPRRVGYFESWNSARPCLHMDITEVNTDYYTHLHFAFGNLSADWVPDVSGAQDQFNGFKNLQGVKRILSFGGWAFSTDPSTYQIFRTGVLPENRQTFANNVVNFVKSNGLDGIDFDWEYPGAPDIPGIPPDSTESGANYLAFLKLVRAGLDSSQSLSIAAPASYWYLKGFPISDISNVVTYIIYMAYDLHGQWDYGNKFVDPGCPGDGNCLRHQTNQTEIEEALAMVTKAGVAANQIVMGMPLYGRSFQMASAGCDGPECAYTGPQSGATPGRCTQTAGYISNFEIFEIITNATAEGKQIDQFYDTGDILVYDETQWISWMAPETYFGRQLWAETLNFGGTSDWAIDLNLTAAYFGDTGNNTDGGWPPETWPICDYTITFASLNDLNSKAGNYRSDCVQVYTMQVLNDMFETAYENYTTVNNGYDEEFGYYVTYMKNLIPAVLANDFFFDAADTGPNALADNMGPGAAFFNCKLPSGTTIPCTQLNQSSNFFDASQGTTVLTVSDEDGYNKAVVNLGFDTDWVVFGDYSYTVDFFSGRGGGKKVYTFTGFPVLNQSMVVPNPKDIVTKGLGNIPDLQASLSGTYMDMILGNWIGGFGGDPMQAYSTPVFMLMQGVDSMAQAKQLGQQEQQQEEEEEKRKKDFILMIVSVVLMFVPVIGEELALAAGMASLARAISIAGELGNAALGLYDTVTDPKSAIVNVLGMLIGIGAITKVVRDGKGIGDVANIRRGMSATEVSSMGKIFSDNDATLQGIAKVCKLS